MRIPARWLRFTPLIPELGRQRHSALCEFEVSMVYIKSPRPVQGDTQRNTVSEKKKGGGWGASGGDFKFRYHSQAAVDSFSGSIVILSPHPTSGGLLKPKLTLNFCPALLSLSHCDCKHAIHQTWFSILPWCSIDISAPMCPE